jgi:AAA+ ATPase superfamily predicted ATPase
MVQNNPFLIEGYLSPEYFCDRTDETALLTRHITNRCNVALIAPRRLGKSGLIHNCFYQKELHEHYYCIYIDIYDTKNLSEFVYALGKGILTTLKPKGRKVWEAFLNILQSLRSTISFDINGNPEWSVGIGDIQAPDITLDEIFAYLDKAEKPCVVAIDEFQTVASYPEKTVEAALRKRIQNCHNATFIFSGSKRHMMALMFSSQSRPFYHSSSIMGLAPINPQSYLAFANRHLSKAGKQISEEAFSYLYNRFDGITWYIQYVLNMLYTSFSDRTELSEDDVRHCIDNILSQQRFAYESLLFQLTSKQKQLLTIIAKEGKVGSVFSQDFLHTYRLSASTMQGVVKALLDKDFITQDDGVYQLCDKFLECSLREKA